VELALTWWWTAAVYRLGLKCYALQGNLEAERKEEEKRQEKARKREEARLAAEREAAEEHARVEAARLKVGANACAEVIRRCRPTMAALLWALCREYVQVARTVFPCTTHTETSCCTVAETRRTWPSSFTLFNNAVVRNGLLTPLRMGQSVQPVDPDLQGYDLRLVKLIFF